MLLRSAINKLLETVPFLVKSCSYVALDFRTSTSGKTAKGRNCTEQTIHGNVKGFCSRKAPEFILLH